MAEEFIQGVRNYLDHAERSDYSRLEIQHGLTAILMYVGTRNRVISKEKKIVTPEVCIASADQQIVSEGFSSVLSSDDDTESGDTDTEITTDTAGNRLLKGEEALAATDLAWGSSMDVFDLAKGSEHEFRPTLRVPESVASSSNT